MSPLVIWDFDGPIFNSRRPRDIAFERVLTKFADKLGACSFDYSAAPLYDPRKFIRLAFADQNLAAEVLDQIETEYRSYLRVAEAEHKLDREVITTLKNLEGAQCKLAILSLRSEESLINLLQQYRLFPLFKFGVLGRDTSPASKPSPSAVHFIMDNAKASAAETILIGDSDHDLKAARAAGIAYFHAGWSGEPAALAHTQADLILTHPSEVEMIVMQGFSPLPASAQGRNELTKIARSEKFSFFAGAGVSIDAGFGSWKSCYLPILNEHLPASSLTGFSLSELVQMIVAEEDRAKRLFDAFKKTFEALPEPTSYHYAMMRSACDTIWTTNYDSLFERVSLLLGQAMPVVRDDSELKESFGSGRKLIKMNGDFQAAKFNPKSLDWGVVLSDEQFDLSEVERPEMWRYFEDEYRTSSLIFVGVSFGDPTLRRIISIISRKVMRTRRPHFVLAAMPRTPSEHLIVSKQIEVLRRRNIRTLLFDDYAAIAEFVGNLCILSRKPLIAFSGTAYRTDENVGQPGVNETAEGKLDGGVLSFSDIERLCGEMGATLAREGFRVASGNGARVGTPAVAAAYEEDRRSARYYMRKHGATQGSRNATTIYVADDDINAVRQKLAGVAHVLVAMGGASKLGWESGTVKEVRMAIERGRPVILFRQGGGDVDKCYPELMDLVQQKLNDSELRNQVDTLNKYINKMDRQQVVTFIEREFLSSVRSLIRASLGSSHTSYFVTACMEADNDW
jgi:HAD superfamily hydrolase (TIGR01549 family)